MKPLLLIVLLLTFSNKIIAQKDSLKMHAAIVGFFNGLSVLDADTLRYYATPDFQLLEEGEVWNMDTLISKVMPAKYLKRERINTFHFIRTEQAGNMAWVSYHNTAFFTQGEKQQTVRWMESVVLVKDKNRWRIQMMHSTRMK